MKKPVNVANAAPSAGAYSETFIHMRVDELNCALQLYGLPSQLETVPGGALPRLQPWRGVPRAAQWLLRGSDKRDSPHEFESKKRFREQSV